MGLGKPWKPSSEKQVYAIYRLKDLIDCSIYFGNTDILEFPTEEIRDTFYENFKELIEQCKELL